jgi:hypothetical protein
MQIKDLFVKPIDRSIEGVIKADANEHIKQEVEEYVLTKEIARKLEDFLIEYTEPQSGNGSWISGFFGSGKSHLLKMLSMLLENKTIDGTKMVEYFQTKTRDQLLSGKIAKITDIPSKSILFNIDQKATITSKKQSDAVLSVFVKVFNEMQGYYGGIDYVAKLESDLHKRGQLDAFKQAIHEITNRPWEEVREESLLEEDSIDQAYAIASGKESGSIQGILEKYKDSYKMSIEDFANNVKDYIEEHDKQFRLNFFVDEVGQFIADNVKLMTNLQTIAESLNTKCKGRSWILVTAQEDMETIVGEQTKQQANDFSKIQARFHNRIKLTSKDVAEVIQKRLLDKTPQARVELRKLYERECENLETLFRFTENSRRYKSYEDEEHFISCYPFVPYQFELFQSSMEKLSAHNAFEGKYSSVGERSMLGVFQRVGAHLMNQSEGTLATFDAMFEGIRSTLKSATQRDILAAENNLGNNFALQVLKALFLVKYCKEFKPTLPNIMVLLIDSFSTDMQKLRHKTQEALDLLVQQTYIQRNGEYYEYLTDKEKDVEKEIKNMEINQEEKLSLFHELLSDYIPSSKLTHKGYRQDFSYTLKIDDTQKVRTNEEVTIHFITPDYIEYDNVSAILMKGMTYPELLFYLPLQKHWSDDVSQYIRTRKYYQTFAIKDPTLEHIVNKQREANQKRKEDIKDAFRDMLQEATVYKMGQEIALPNKNPKERIQEGFQKLIDSVYRNRHWIGDKQYKEDDILKALNDDPLITALSAPVEEVHSYVKHQTNTVVRLSIKQIKDHFAKPPYGWEPYAVLTFLAKLWSNHKIEFLKDHIVEENSKALFELLKNSRNHDSITVRTQKEYSPSQIRTLQEFYKGISNIATNNMDAKALARETQKAISEALEKYHEMEKQIRDYPFCKPFENAVQELQRVSKKETDWYFTQLQNCKDDLLQQKEEILEPIKAFLNSSQKSIFDQIQQFLQDEKDNITLYLSKKSDVEELQKVTSDPKCYLNNSLNKAKNIFTDLKENLDKTKASEKNRIEQKLQTLLSTIPQNIEQHSAFCTCRDKAISSLKESTTISTWDTALRNLEDTIQKLQTVTQNQEQISDPVPETGFTNKPQTQGDDTTIPTIVFKETILESELMVNFKKPFIENDQDVDTYIQNLAEALRTQIQKGKIIQWKKASS